MGSLGTHTDTEEPLTGLGIVVVHKGDGVTGSCAHLRAVKDPAHIELPVAGGSTQEI